jgi:hypothetical protein
MKENIKNKEEEFKGKEEKKNKRNFISIQKWNRINF